MGEDKLRIRPLSDCLGAEITGIDASNLEPEALQTIYDAFHQYLVIVLPCQNLTPAQQIDFSRCFGELEVPSASPRASAEEPYLSTRFRLQGYPEVLVLSNRVDERGHYVGVENAGDTWHSDMSYVQKPSCASVLYALEVPEEGGDTEWANMYAAYETLDEGLKRRVEGLHARHSFSWHRNPRVRVPEQFRNLRQEEYESFRPLDAVHPVVRTHPVTGRKALFISPRFTIAIEGMDSATSQALLDDLFEHAIQRRFIYHHRWREGDLVLWDNRCTLHIACRGVVPPGIRHMHRTTIVGDVPF